MARRRPGMGYGAIYGALGGIMGAACMTVLRLAARRTGLIDRMVPQAVEEWLADRARAHLPSVWHHTIDQALHLGYGATLGALYGAAGALAGGAVLERERWSTGAGVVYGLGVWLGGSWLALPRLGVTGDRRRAGPAELAVDGAAHATYGLALGLVASELARQPRRTTSDLERKLTRVG